MEYERIVTSQSRKGLADRFQRLKDASISIILEKAEGKKKRPDLKALLEIIQLATLKS